MAANRLALYEEIGARIKQFAKEVYGNQSELAKALGVSDVQLSQWVSGAVGQGQKILVPLARLGCNVHWLLTGIGSWRVDGSQVEPRRLSNKELLRQIEERMVPDSE